MPTTTTKPSSNVVSLVCILGAILLTAYIFAASRLDPGLRMAALVSSTSIASALIAIASTLLVGRDVTNKTADTTDPNDLPPGSLSTSSSVQTVQTPPVTVQPPPQPQPPPAGIVPAPVPATSTSTVPPAP